MWFEQLTTSLGLSVLDYGSHSHSTWPKRVSISVGELLDPPSHRGLPAHLGYGLRVGWQHSIGVGMVMAGGRQPEASQWCSQWRAGTESENLEMASGVVFPS